jgi:hypothetical protein
VAKGLGDFGKRFTPHLAIFFMAQFSLHQLSPTFPA